MNRENEQNALSARVRVDQMLGLPSLLASWKSKPSRTVRVQWRIAPLSFMQTDVSQHRPV